MIVPSGQSFPSRCVGIDKEIMEIRRRIYSAPNMAISMVCNHCNCVCHQSYHEKNGTFHGFFVDTDSVIAGRFLNSNKLTFLLIYKIIRSKFQSLIIYIFRVVVGARLVVEPFHTNNLSGKALRIQIKKATLSAYGALVDEQWKPTEYSTYDKDIINEIF